MHHKQRPPPVPACTSYVCRDGGLLRFRGRRAGVVPECPYLVKGAEYEYVLRTVQDVAAVVLWKARGSIDAGACDHPTQPAHSAQPNPAHASANTSQQLLTWPHLAVANSSSKLADRAPILICQCAEYLIRHRGTGGAGRDQGGTAVSGEGVHLVQQHQPRIRLARLEQRPQCMAGIMLFDMLNRPPSAGPSDR